MMGEEEIQFMKLFGFGLNFLKGFAGGFFFWKIFSITKKCKYIIHQFSKKHYFWLFKEAKNYS